jgi:hypothetical protein
MCTRETDRKRERETEIETENRDTERWTLKEFLD